MFGFTFTFGLTGAVIGMTQTKNFVLAFGYAETMNILVMLTCIIALSLLLFGKLDDVYETENWKITMSKVGKLLINKEILIVSICGGLMVGSLEGFSDVWAMQFFTHVYLMDPKDSDVATSFVYIGMCVGGPLLALIATMLRSNYITIMLAGVFTIIIFGIIFSTKTMPFGYLVVIMFVLGILCCYQVLIFASVSKVAGKFASLAVAIANSINMSFGHVFHMALGYIVYANWDGALNEHHLPQYSYDGLLAGIIIVPVLCLVALIGFSYLVIKNTEDFLQIEKK
jgi:hypothetical protein